MFWLLRRLFWFGTGASLGFGGAMWIRSRILRVVERLAPEHVTTEVAGNVKRAGSQVGSKARRATTTVRVAVDEGRAAARQREASLREALTTGDRSPASDGAVGNDQGVGARHH